MRCVGIKCFDKDLKCRGFQFEVGKTYEVSGDLEFCKNGFHFLHYKKNIFNLFGFYSPANTRYCLVVATDFLTDSDKSVAKKIKVLKELSIHKVNLIRNRHIGDESSSSNTGFKSSSSNTGDESSSSNTGDESSSSNTGDRSSSSNTGFKSSSSNTGSNSSSSNTGFKSSSSNTGFKSSSSNTGDESSSSNTGSNSSSSNTGSNSSSSNTGSNGIAIASGINGRAMCGATGAIVIQNWKKNENGGYEVTCGLYARVGDFLPNGEVMKANTWYWFEDGNIKSEVKNERNML